MIYSVEDRMDALGSRSKTALAACDGHRKAEQRYWVLEFLGMGLGLLALLAGIPLAPGGLFILSMLFAYLKRREHKAWWAVFGCAERALGALEEVSVLVKTAGRSVSGKKTSPLN